MSGRLSVKGFTTFAAVLAAAFVIGCGRQPMYQGPFDPPKLAEQALTQYDRNSDGGIDSQEANASPGLKTSFPRMDQDGNGLLTQPEIERRVSHYRSAATLIVPGRVQVTFKGKPLVGASVVFEPESFLGETFCVCEGTTDDEGVAIIKAKDADFPGIYLGIYRIRISRMTKGKEVVPPQYNTETTLGFEAAGDEIDANSSAGVILELK